MEMRTDKFMIYVFSAIMLGGMVACSSDDPETDTGNGNGNGGNAEAPYVWGAEGAIKTCDHLLFDDDKTENAKGTVIGNGDQEFIFKGTQTLSKGTYLMKGWIYVGTGSVLTIEPGTVIKGDKDTQAALIVEPGGKLIAEGTKDAPIVFTSEQPKGQRKPGDWGGLIICGNAKNNQGVLNQQIEGGPRTKHGGNDDADNSGVLTYVSIRHGGTNIGADNEINGLTLGAIGSGTKIEYIEVIANNDDGIEFFGGTVDVKNAVIAYCADDSYDWDQGYRGRGQFWLAVQSADIASDRLCELDGADLPEDGLPFGGGTIYNATLIGAGEAAAKRTLTFRANGGGAFFNCVFANQAKGVDIEHKPVAQDAYKRLVDGQLKVEYNVFDGVAGNTAAKLIGVAYVGSFKDKVTDSTDAKAFVANYASKANNLVAATGIVTTIAGFNPVPTGNVANVTTPSDAYFTKVSYNGAFAPNGTNWAKGWTRLFQ